MNRRESWRIPFQIGLLCLLVITTVLDGGCRGNRGIPAAKAFEVTQGRLAGTWSLMATGIYYKPTLTPICPFTLKGSFTLDASGSGTGLVAEHGCARDFTHADVSFVITSVAPTGIGTATFTLLSESAPIQLEIQVDRDLRIMTFVDTSDPNLFFSGTALLQ
jgi:hypothetical protein